MHDLIVRPDRVLNPKTGLDTIADVAVLDGRIVAIRKVLGYAAQVIGAAGLIVAPGFIDLHAHGK